MSSLRVDPAHRRRQHVYLECSETATNLLKTGIQRVVRNVVLHRNDAAQMAGVDASPVRFFGEAFYPFDWQPTSDSHETGWGEALNRRVTRMFGELVADRWVPRLNIAAARAKKAVRFRKVRRYFHSLWLKKFGQPLRPNPGDVMVLVDATWGLPIWSAVRNWREQGGKVAFVIYDILAITHSQFFRANLSQRFAEWFDQVMENSDLLLAISDTVRDQLRELIRQRMGGTREPRPLVESFHLGAELDMRHDGAYIRPPVRAALAPTAGAPPYVMVGTVEPRKNHQTALDAFDRLWERGRDSRLFVIGRRGWECTDLERRMLSHPQYGRKLFWFPDMSDSELNYCYQKARGVVFASWGEGFGLPIVEGLQAGRPVIASDLPVHREVAGNHVAYFNPASSEELAAWIERLETNGVLPGVAPASDFRAVTWLEGTTELLSRCRDAFSPHVPHEATRDQREESQRHEGGGQLGSHDPSPALLGDRGE